MAVHNLQKYKVHETLPDPNTEVPVLPRDRSIRVYTDYELVVDHLTDNRFELVDKKEEADIIWTSKTIRNYLWVCLSSFVCIYVLI